MQDTRFTVNVEELRAKLAEMLQQRFPDSFDEVESSTIVSPSVGSDLFAEALLALLYAIVGMLIYITLRFDVRFAPGAVVALAHDALVTLGLFAILQIKFTLPIVAALLTIIGYSVNDTIIVFDRIRENIGKRSGAPLYAIINQSVNETLSRTILTTATTLVTVIAILILGGGLIWDFALALLIGMLTGVYSSVYVASPVAIYLDNYLTARAAQRKAVR
jgi:preprotein translocase subunit SecF